MKKTKKLDARDLRRMAGLFTVAEVAAQMDTNVWTAYGQIREGRWPPPTTTIMGGSRRYYTRKEVELLQRLVSDWDTPGWSRCLP